MYYYALVPPSPKKAHEIGLILSLVVTTKLEAINYYKGDTLLDATQPPLTRTCRQIRSECMPTFYEQKIFVFFIENHYEAKQLHQWINSTGTRYARTIRHVAFVGREHGSNSGLGEIRVGVNLRSHRIILQNSGSEPPHEAEVTKDTQEFLDHMRADCLASPRLRMLLGVFKRFCVGRS